jgi:hypothetical protein
VLRGSFQGTQTLGPEHLEGCPELSDGLRSRAVETLRPVAPFGDESRLLQDAKVLRDRRSGDVEAARDIADRELLARDEPKDLAAPGFAEGGKSVDFLRVSARLLTVKALRRSVVTDSRLNHDRTGRSPCTALARAFLPDTLEVTEMVAVAQDLVPVQARHWAARPLPEPPRSHRLSKSAPPQHDRIGLLLEDWMRELTVGNTLDGE